MALVNNIETIKASLNKIPVKAGQQIFCSDTMEIYHDDHDGIRKQISDIIKLNTETDRKDILAPLNNKLYLVLETNTLYRYSGEWIQLNNNHIVSFSKNTVTVSSNTPYVDLGISSYDASTDMLLVFVNSTYVENNEYKVSNNKLYPLEGGWIADSTNKLIFNIIALKNVTDVNKIVNYSIASMSDNQYETNELYNELAILTKINFKQRADMKQIPSTNMMKQYYNSSSAWDKTYLNELLQNKYITQTQYDEIIK